MNKFWSKSVETAKNIGGFLQAFFAFYMIALLIEIGIGLRGEPVSEMDLGVVFGAPAIVVAIIMLMILVGEIGQRRDRYIATPPPVQPTGTHWCVKCKTHREVRGEAPVRMKNGRLATKGRCTECGTGTYSIA